MVRRDGYIQRRASTVYVCVYIYGCVCVTCALYSDGASPQLYTEACVHCVCVCVCVYVCVNVFICVCVCEYVCMYVYICIVYVCMYVCMYACMYICVYVYIQQLFVT
jgi:hypothetical protein